MIISRGETGMRNVLVIGLGGELTVFIIFLTNVYYT